VPDDFDPAQLELSGLGKNILPKAYADIKTTKLSATIKPRANDGVDFNLEGQ
jgi:hypothetical protein